MTSLDYKVSSLRRQLDKLRSRNKAHTTYLNILIAEADKMAGTDSKQVNRTFNCEAQARVRQGSARDGK